MPGNRNGSTSRGGTAAPCTGYKGCPNAQRAEDAKQLSRVEEALADARQSLQNKDAARAARAFGDLINGASRSCSRKRWRSCSRTW